MPRTIEIKGWIFAKPNDYGNKIDFEFSSYDYEAAAKRGYAGADWGSYKKVAEHTIVAEVPDDIDPVAMKLAALEAERTDLRAKYAARVAQIENEISKLTAIECAPAEAATA